MEDNIKALLREIDPEDWDEEGKREILTAVKVIDSLSQSFSIEDIETLCKFFSENEWSPSIMTRLLEKKIKIIKNIPNEANHEPLTLFKSERAWVQKLKSMG